MQEAKNDNNSTSKRKVKEVYKSNRFTLLDSLVNEDELVHALNEREIVDKKDLIDVMDDMDSRDVVEEVNAEGNSCLRNKVDGGW
ncbi:hypothetical protein Tco_0101161, partial [Tanacetum coccineum]